MNVNDLIDRDRIGAARAAHQSAIKSEGAAGREADRLHNAWAAARVLADKALLGKPGEAEAAQAKCDAAEKAARLAGKIAAARTTALSESAKAMAEEILQSYSGAVRSAVLARIAAVRRAADLQRQMADTVAEYSAADRDLQACQASGGVSYPLEMKIGNGLLDGNGKPIVVALHEAYLRGCGVNIETGQMPWMDAGNE